MSSPLNRSREPYSTKPSPKRDFLADYRAKQVDVIIDSNDGNLLVTGRPNSGIEDFRELLIKHLESKNESYTEISIVDISSVYTAIAKIKENSGVTILDDPHRMLFAFGGDSIKGLGKLVYFTRHWNLKTDGSEYLLFAHHIAFASQRNQSISDYPSPFAGIGSDLSKGEYVSVSTGAFSIVSKTTVK